MGEREEGRKGGREGGRERLMTLIKNVHQVRPLDKFPRNESTVTTYRFVVHMYAYVPMYTLIMDHKHTNHD